MWSNATVGDETMTGSDIFFTLFSFWAFSMKKLRIRVTLNALTTSPSNVTSSTALPCNSTTSIDSNKHFGKNHSWRTVRMFVCRDAVWSRPRRCPQSS